MIFKQAATTPFGTLKPAKVVARSMALLSELRTQHALNWRSVSQLFNQAMTSAGGSNVEPATLCRLYQLQRKRLQLKALGNAETFTGSGAEMSSTSIPKHASRAVASSEERARQEYARDGPQKPRDLASSISPLPSAAETLEISRRIEEHRREAKKK